MYPVCVCGGGGSPGGVTEGGGGVVQTPAETWCDHEILQGITSPRCRRFDLLRIRRLCPPRRGTVAHIPAPDSETRSRSVHAVALPENVTFPLPAHHPPLKTARMTSSRHGSTSAGRAGGAAVDRHIRRGGSLHLLWASSSSFFFLPQLCSFPLPLRRTQRKHHRDQLFPNRTGAVDTGAAHPLVVRCPPPPRITGLTEDTEVMTSLFISFRQELSSDSWYR